MFPVIIKPMKKNLKATGVTIIVILGAGCLLSLGGCRTAHKANVGGVQNSPPSVVDPTEVLIEHLVHRVDELTSEVGKQQNETLAHDNRCLEEEIAELEGRPIHRPKEDPTASARKLAETTEAGSSRMIQALLDGEDAIEYHNQRHPEAPWADVKDVVRLMCGDCARERAIRNTQLEEEAKKLNASAERARIVRGADVQSRSK
jgi:hypothetical protein